MIRDEDLKSSVDYSEGQKRAAHKVLVELVNIFQEYEEEVRVVGGWVPDLMFPGECQCCGSSSLYYYENCSNGQGKGERCL